MQENEKILKIISNETKKSINNLSVVTPAIYSGIFSNLVSSHHINFDDEKTTDSLLNEKISLFSNLQEKTSQNANQLDKSTYKAIEAIKKKDETILSEVLKETENLRHEVEKLKESIYKDELTKVFNRKWLNDNLLNEKTQNFKDFGVLAILDLNYFKIVNDTYGHIVGDKVLIFIANQLKRLKEKVIRFGGDEFIIIFSNKTTKAVATKKLSAIRENILKKHIKIKDISFKISFSFGVQNFLKDDNLTDIVNLADKKMYKDKMEMKQRIKGI